MTYAELLVILKMFPTAFLCTKTLLRLDGEERVLNIKHVELWDLF